MRSLLLMTLVVVMLNTAESDCTATVGFYGLEEEDINTLKQSNKKKKLEFVKSLYGTSKKRHPSLSAHAKALKQRNLKRQSNAKIALEVVGAVIVAVSICLGTMGTGCPVVGGLFVEGAATLGLSEATALLDLQGGTALAGVGGTEGSGVATYGGMLSETLAEEESVYAVNEAEDFYFIAGEEEDGLFGLRIGHTRDNAFDFTNLWRESRRNLAGPRRKFAVPRPKLVSFGGGPCALVDNQSKNRNVTVTYLTRKIKDPTRDKSAGAMMCPTKQCIQDTDLDLRWTTFDDATGQCTCNLRKDGFDGSKAPACQKKVSKNICGYRKKPRECPGGGYNCQYRYSSDGTNSSSDAPDDPDSAVEPAASGLVGISSGLVGHVLLALVLLCIAL